MIIPNVNGFMHKITHTSVTESGYSSIKSPTTRSKTWKSFKKTKIKRYERREKEYKETRLDDQYSSFSRATRAQKQDWIVASLRDRGWYNELQLAMKKKKTIFYLGFIKMKLIYGIFRQKTKQLKPVVAVWRTGEWSEDESRIAESPANQI